MASTTNSHRFFSTSKQRFEDGSDKDKNDKKGGGFEFDLKQILFVSAILALLMTLNSPSNSVDVLQVSYNDFFYNMLQAGEVAEIIIYPGENRENSAIILLRQGAMYKVSLFKYQK